MIAGLSELREVMDVQEFVTEHPVKRFNQGVFHGLPNSWSPLHVGLLVFRVLYRTAYL